MNDEYENGISPAKMAQGRREVGKFCFCGKPRWKHTVMEAKECMKTAKTETVGRIMNRKEKNDMEPVKR